MFSMSSIFFFTISCSVFYFFFFFFNDTATTEIYTLSLHDALPISRACCPRSRWSSCRPTPRARSEEHTSELQSRENLVCRLLLEKKKNKKQKTTNNQKTYREHDQAQCSKST